MTKFLGTSNFRSGGLGSCLAVALFRRKESLDGSFLSLFTQLCMGAVDVLPGVSPRWTNVPCSGEQ